MADYDGMNGHALKQKVNGATGYAPSMTSSSDDLNQKARDHTDAATMLTQVCDMLNDSWKGDAAEAARAHLKTMRDSVTNASAVNMTPAAQANQTEAEAHTDTNHKMVDMPDKPDHKGWLSNGAAHVADFFGGDAKTNEDLKNDWNSSNEHNIRVYQQYEQQSTNNSLAFDRDFPDVKMPSDSVDSGHHSSDSVGVGSDSAGSTGGPAGATAASGAGGAGGAGSTSTPSGGMGGGAGVGSGHGGSGGATGGAAFSGAPGAGGAFAGGSPSGHASGSLNKPAATWKPSVPPSSAPFKDDKFSGDTFKPSDIPAASGGTSAAGFDGGGGAGFDPSTSGGFGGGGFGSGSHQSGSGGAGGAAGAAGMMPMTGGVGMGAGAGGDQVRSGGGFGKGLGNPAGGGAAGESLGGGARSGAGGFGPQNAGAAAAESQAANAARGGSGMGGMGAGAGRGKGKDDEAEHEDDYYMKDELDVGLTTTDEWGEKIVDETTGMVVPPEVIGDN